MRDKILGVLDSKFGPIAFALSEYGVQTKPPYIDQDGKPTCDHFMGVRKSSVIVVRGIPYTFHLEIKLKDIEWVVAHIHINRADDKKFDVRPSDSAISAIKAELTAVWVKYISQNPEFLAEVKIGSLEKQIEGLQEKNAELQREIADNEAKIKDVEVSLAMAEKLYTLKYKK